MSRPREDENSWDANARAWTRLVRREGIESRRLGGDAAILDAIVSRSPARVLDVGCGEGWLCRALSERGVAAHGVDGSAELIDAARAAGGGEFQQLSYDEIVADTGRMGAAAYDVVVCNFSLLDEDIGPLLRSLATLLVPGGAVIVQTVHPWVVRGDEPYADGWRTESFSGFDEPFAEPMPWYYRTLASWAGVLRGAGYRIEAIREPTHPETGDPLSLILVAAGGG